MSSSSVSAGIPVTDPTQIAEAIKNAITQLEQLQAAYDQYSQLIAEYEQAIRNATKLGNLDELAGLLEAYTGLTNSQATADVMGQAYGLDPTAGDFGQQLRNVLSQTYDLPTNPETFHAELEEYFAENTNGADGFVATSERMVRDFEESVALQQAVSRSVAGSQQSQSSISSYQNTLQGLGNDQLAASVQLGVASTLHTAGQNEAILDQLRIRNLRAEAETLRRIEEEQNLLRYRADRLRDYSEGLSTLTPDLE